MASNNTTLNPSNGKGYTLSVSFSETITDEQKAKNKSTINTSGTLQANGTYWVTSHNSTLTLYWHDNKNNKDIEVAKNVFAGLSGYYDSKTVSASFEVEHKSDGTLSGYAFVSFDKGSTTAAQAPKSGSVSTALEELTTIPRTTKLADKTGTIGEELNITWSKASSSFRHKLVYSFGDIENEVLGEDLVDSFSWTPSTDLYQYIKDSPSETGTLTLTTYSGETVIGSSTAKLTLNAKDDETTKPIIDAGWVYDSRDLTVNLTGDNTKLVIGQSTAVLNLQFTSQQYATIKSLKVNGVEQSFTPQDIKDDNGKFIYVSCIARINYENVATNIFNIVITDSRGFVNEEYIITNEKVDYIDLDCLPTFKRIQPTTGEIGLEFDGKYFNQSFGKIQNTLKISYAYKIKEEENYSDEIVFEENIDYKIVENTFHSGDSDYKSQINLGAIFNYKKAYNLVLYVEDEITRLVINVLVVKGIPIFWWNGEKVTINGDLYLADEDGNNPINVKNLVGGGGYDSLPVGSIINFDGDEVPVGYEEISDPNVYSTEEKIIGKWADGSDLYRKTFIVPNDSTLTQISVQHNIQNLNEVTDVRGSVKTYTSWKPITNAYVPDVAEYSVSIYNIHPTNGTFQILVGATLAREQAFKKANITLEYTKTTD